MNPKECYIILVTEEIHCKYLLIHDMNLSNGVLTNNYLELRRVNESFCADTFTLHCRNDNM